MSETYTNNVGRSDYRLPTVSANDNGKILKVVEGEWKKAEGGGSGLPEVTVEDAGDVLTVSEDGEWEAAAPGGGGGLTLYGPYLAKNNSQYSVGTTGTYISLDKIFDLDENEVSRNNDAVYLMESFGGSNDINLQSVSVYSIFATSLTGSSVTVGQFDCRVGFYSTIELQPVG